MDWRLFVCVLLAAYTVHGSSLHRQKRSSGLFDHLKEVARSRSKRQTSGCGSSVNLITTEGEITSPNYPGDYPNDANCRWKIRAPQGKVVNLEFLAFALEDSSGCQYDELQIFNGGGVNAPLMASLCGGVLPSSGSSSNRLLFLKFTSDSSDADSGFRVRFSFVDQETTTSPDSGGPAATPACGSSSSLTTTTGTLTSPNDPDNNGKYPNGAECIWTISAPTGKRIKLTVSGNFRLEPSAGCAYDSLSVYDGENENSLILGRFCGQNFPSAGVESSGNDLYVVFRSDSSIVATGFRVEWEFVQPETTSNPCGGALGGTSGQLSSPNYGSANYPNNANCVWVIDVGENKIVKLEFSDFNIEQSSTCVYDSVTIYDGENKNSPKLGTYCGGQPEPIDSTGKYLLVEFTSDSSVRKRGFSATYTAVNVEEAPKDMPGCGADRPALLAEAEGTIESPSRAPSANYPDNSFCQWRVTVPEGKRAHLHLDSFSLEPASSCQYDHLEVFDGPDANSRKLGRYCGNDIPGEITATRNVLLVQFTSDSSVTATGFSITYSAKDAGGNTQPGGGGGGAGSGEPACGIPDVQPKFGRIVGGTEASPNSWPWQISLRQYGSHFCGGSVISKRWVITAAHCVPTGNTNQISVALGDHDLKTTGEGTEVFINVESISVHENYDADATANDIALLRLASDIPYSSAIKPVCLPRGDAATDMTCVTTGWGETQNTGDNTVLNQVRVPIIERELCKQRDWYGGSFTSVMICAGYPEGGKDSCQGDSGGPLVCRENGVFRLQGITSWGFGCAEAKAPGVYTRVASFIDWVDSKTSGAFQSPP